MMRDDGWTRMKARMSYDEGASIAGLNRRQGLGPCLGS
jgi:hypothetical protein